MTTYTIGEALIDFIPSHAGALGDDTAFKPAVGGAPLNVAAAVAKLGGHSTMLTQVGLDDFGDYIIQVAKEAGVNTMYLRQTDLAKTALAFVTLADDGERSFSFYRSPSADMLYEAKNLDEVTPTADDVLHFCSVSLAPEIMRNTHEVAIKKWREAGALISFDINIRLPLWEQDSDCRDAVQAFIPKADLIKISDDELEFVTGETDVEQGIATLFKGNVRYVIYTRGANGAQLYNKNGLLANRDAHRITAVDATGAGDAFTGAFLHQMQQQAIRIQDDWDEKQAQSLLSFATKVGALTTLRRGAINSLPSMEDVKTFD